MADLPQGPKTVNDFSEQIKREITNGLSVDDAAQVVLAAANNAGSIATNELRKVSPDYPKLSGEMLNHWCNNDAKLFILNVMRVDQDDHEKFLKNIETAKH